MVLSYDDIRRIFRLEKSTANLVEVDLDFYAQLRDFIRLEKEAYMSSLGSMSMAKANNFANLKKMIHEIYSIREKKLLNLALLASRTNELNEKHMANEEKELYRTYAKILREKRAILTNVFNEEVKSQVKRSEEKAIESIIEPDLVDDIEEIETSSEVIEDIAKDVVKLKILMDIPSFIGSDMKEYGPYKKDDEVFLPSEIAKLFLSRNLGTQVI